MVVSCPGQFPKVIRPDMLKMSFCLFTLNRFSSSKVSRMFVKVKNIANFGVTTHAGKQHTSAFIIVKKGNLTSSQRSLLKILKWVRACRQRYMTLYLPSSNIT